MKKILSVFLILVVAIVYSQEGIQFSELSFNEVLAKAKKENKLVFLDAYASWCGPCKMLDRKVFPLKTVGDFYNKNFVNTHIDMEKGEGPQIAQRYQIRSYPTLLILNSDGEVIQKTMGYTEEKEFLEFGKQASDPKNKLGTPKERFEKGEKDPAFLMNLIKLNANSDFDLSKRASERYFANKSDHEFSKDEVSILFYFTKSAQDPNFKTLKDNKAEIIKLVPENSYQEFMGQIAVGDLAEKSVDVDKKLVNDAYFLQQATSILGETEAKIALNRLQVSFYAQVENYPAYEKAALEYYKNYDNFNDQELEKAAWIFCEQVKNIKSLQEATKWAGKAVMNSESPSNTYVLAKLYQKTGNKENAKMFAELANSLAKSKAMDTALSEQLLKELNK